MERSPIDLIAEALDLSARPEDEAARQERVEALWRQASPQMVMTAIALTHAEAAASRRLGADVLGGMGAGDPMQASAANSRLLELMRAEQDPGVMRAVMAAMGRMLD